MKIDTELEVNWMPAHYSRLSELCIKNGARDIVNPMLWGMAIGTYSEPHVKQLSSAASKYRLAYYCEGLRGPEEDARIESGLGASYFEKYSAQALVMLSFVALEAHLRMLSTKWQKFPHCRMEAEYVSVAEVIRTDLGTTSMGKLREAMYEDRLKKRIDKFIDGDDVEIFAVISALRNAFSHGKLGISQTVSMDCALQIKSFLLSTIAADAELISVSLETQDATLIRL